MIRARIAPTPSGYLHIGNVVNFAITWLWVRQNKGHLRLRIDDLDTQRAKPEYIEDIFNTLKWLGLDWDEGPQSAAEQELQYSQKRRKDRYDEWIAKLIETNRVFACTCSRKQIEELHVCNCRQKNLPLNTPDAALRIYTPVDAIFVVNDIKRGKTEVNLYNEMRDFVIRRRDGIAAYQVASVVDDIDFDINLIVRGEDLISSTAAQLYLSGLLNQNSFAETTFYHHRLLKNEQGEKLSKSAGSVSIKSWRESGDKPEKFYLFLSSFWGLKEPVLSLGEMLEQIQTGLVKLES